MKKARAAALAVVMLVCLSTQIVLAHACSYVELGGTKIQFIFSDGTPMSGAKIIVTGADEERLGTGITSKEGIYDYVDYAGAAVSIAANDGEGHMCTYEVPEILPEAAEEDVSASVESSAPISPEPTEEPLETPDVKNNLPIIITIIVVIAVVIVGCGIVFLRTKKQK